MVLVVDDNPVDRRLTGRIVSKRTGCHVLYAAHGKQALEILARESASAVLTDMLMPEMDGLELVEQIRSHHPFVPVILMTAYGTEDLAIQALQRGAASYVPKKNLTRGIAATLEQVLAAARASKEQLKLRDYLTGMAASFEMENNPALVPALVAHLMEYLTHLKLCDQTARMRVGIALEEGITNGIYHGNLELSSDLRQDGDAAYQDLAQQRRRQPPYQQRRLHVGVKASRAQAVYTIRDEGPGFDPSTLPDPTDPANMDRVGGRGLLLIRTFMNEVRFNQTGNEITLVKWASGDLA
jgi:CheY-like chemotaxis protein/anti-sigma regulatory factor (Ser/Thr protein kinase)